MDHDGTPRLTSGRYLEALHVEGERLIESARECMDRPVPACEGWSVDDVVFHLGGVYAHKLAVLRLGRRPHEGEWSGPGDDVAPEDDLDWCHAMLHALAGELAHRPAEEPAWTWWDDEQTVGFWQRRMALETAVHRADVESATGVITPVDADLALDGIDELLAVHLAGSDVKGTVARAVEGTRVSVRIHGVTASGDPSAVLLWLWGRLDDAAVTVEGDEDARTRMRDRIRRATQ